MKFRIAACLLAGAMLIAAGCNQAETGTEPAENASSSETTETSAAQPVMMTISVPNMA